MVWKTQLVPWTCTAYWDSWESLRCPDLAAEDCPDLSGYLKEKQVGRTSKCHSSSQ